MRLSFDCKCTESKHRLACHETVVQDRQENITYRSHYHTSNTLFMWNVFEENLSFTNKNRQIFLERLSVSIFSALQDEKMEKRDV